MLWLLFVPVFVVAYVFVCASIINFVHNATQGRDEL